MLVQLLTNSQLCAQKKKCSHLQSTQFCNIVLDLQFFLQNRKCALWCARILREVVRENLARAKPKVLVRENLARAKPRVLALVGDLLNT